MPSTALALELWARIQGSDPAFCKGVMVLHIYQAYIVALVASQTLKCRVRKLGESITVDDDPITRKSERLRIS